MEFIDRKLSVEEIRSLQNKFGDYAKMTIDLASKWIVIGGELHADGENILLEKGSHQDDIWGGGIDFSSKQIDTTAVLNLRPRLNNDNLEILDPVKRQLFIQIVKDYFKDLWH